MADNALARNPPGPGRRVLLTLLAIYAVASLVHFTHNAEFLADYPNLPRAWSPAYVYLAWIGMTIIGVVGWLLLSRGLVLVGLVTLVVYAGLGLDSLGHYVPAPLAAHSVGMNVTILAEVTAAGCVLFEVARQMVRRVFVPGRHPWTPRRSVGPSAISHGHPKHLDNPAEARRLGH